MFALLMQPIHLAIGVIEGVVTAAVLCFVRQMRPEILESALKRESVVAALPIKKVIISLAAVALVTGAVLSVFASARPDGLEWAIEKTAGKTELETKGALLKSAAELQKASAFMPDYDYKSAEEDGSPTGTSAAGAAGAVLTFVLAGGMALLISFIKKKSKLKKSQTPNG
jgi:cobalt/nickel transport system permease protein